MQGIHQVDDEHLLNHWFWSCCICHHPFLGFVRHNAKNILPPNPFQTALCPRHLQYQFLDVHVHVASERIVLGFGYWLVCSWQLDCVETDGSHLDWNGLLEEPYLGNIEERLNSCRSHEGWWYGFCVWSKSALIEVQGSTLISRYIAI